MKFEGIIAVYSTDDIRLYETNQAFNLSELKENEYASFCLKVDNDKANDFNWETACVSVDDREMWCWAKGKLATGKSTIFHIFYPNMQKCMKEGRHTAVWYFDGREAHREEFVFTAKMNWERVFRLPAQNEITGYVNSNRCRSPYLSGWFKIDENTRYTEYSVEFKSDYLPAGTYCCLSNWEMDHSPLKKKYKKVWTEYEGVNAYAGFQRIHDGSTVGIMSFWDVYYEDYNGNFKTIRAQRVYPHNTDKTDTFGGEGTGVHCLAPYEWKCGHWYRMHLRCMTSETTGNTVVEQWVCDLETDKYTHLCSYDLGFACSAFRGATAIFLENYISELAGEVRTLEVRNAMFREETSGRWYRLDEITIRSRGGYPKFEGSYNFGVNNGIIWMITSGVGGDWFGNGRGKGRTTFEI